MNRLCMAALARLHPICAGHRRNIPLELYLTVCGTAFSEGQTAFPLTETRFSTVGHFSSIKSRICAARSIACLV
jgi:hypothetical protein